MVPLFAGLVVGPLAFAAVAARSGMSAGFVAIAALSVLGTMLLPPDSGAAVAPARGA